ncbi:MAG: fimbria/pilus outer membrane usher protein [Candidatus Eremiobacteraeota bacterium]|nr:fimbria/pilus outer membrane usher protein [Candidatus Eremiobacteraeota bacterium]
MAVCAACLMSGCAQAQGREDLQTVTSDAQHSQTRATSGIPRSLSLTAPSPTIAGAVFCDASALPSRYATVAIIAQAPPPIRHRGPLPRQRPWRRSGRTPPNDLYAATLATRATPRRDETHSATALLTLHLNGVELFEVAALVRGDDVLVTRADLAKAGIRGVIEPAQVIAGESYVSLRTLAPAVRYTLDERALALRLSVPVEYLGQTVLDLRGSGERFAPDRGSSAFLNYALAMNGFRRASEFSELGVSVHGNFYYTGFRLDPSGALVRGFSNATFDDQRSMRRWVLGDSFVDSGSLGGASFLAGIGLARNFSLNPYFVRYPGIGVSGSVLTPSTASLYVNGELVGVQQLAPGRFDIRDLPVIAGAGNTQVVIRDAFGRTQTLGSPYYFTTTVLAHGLSEYAYGLGARRSDDGSGSPHYGGMVFNGHENVGLSDWTTAGVRLESGNGVMSSGLSAALRLPVGQVGIAGGWSNAAASHGSAGQFVYGYQSRRWSATASYTALSDRYATLSLRPSDDRATKQWNLGLGAVAGPRASLSLNYGQVMARRRRGATSQLRGLRAVERSSQPRAYGQSNARPRQPR